MDFAAVLLLGYIVVPLVVLYALYFVIRKGVAHGLRDAQRLAAKEGLPTHIDVR